MLLMPQETGFQVELPGDELSGYLLEEERKMTICPKCNKQLEEGAKYCDYCGTQASQIIFCHNCGGQMSAQAAFCRGVERLSAKEQKFSHRP